MNLPAIRVPAPLQKVPKPVWIGGGVVALGLGAYAVYKMKPITRMQLLTTAGGIGAGVGGAYALTSGSRWKMAVGGAIGGGLVTAYYELFVSGLAFAGTSLHEGDSGWAVRVLQSRLTLHGYGPDNEVPGKFGRATTDALKRFQLARGIPVTGVADGATWRWLSKNAKAIAGRYSASKLVRAMKKLGYSIFDDGRWNVVGVRAMLPTTNRFDDEMYIFRKSGGGWELHAYPITTDPGVYYLLAGGTKGRGTYAVAPGQYADSHSWGYHNNKYEALVQTGPMKAYKDANMNAVYDYDPKTIFKTAARGHMNIHKASSNSTTVDDASAGCQVFARSADFEEFLDYLRQTGQKSSSYTLLTGSQV